MSELIQSGLPSSNPVPDRQFVYVQGIHGQMFDELFESIQQFVGQKTKAGENPKSGALLSEDICVVTPDNRQFFGFSIRGDLQGWFDLLAEYARLHGVRLSKIRQNVLEVDDGSAHKLSECSSQTFYR